MSADQPNKSEAALEYIEPLRRRLYVCGAIIVAFGVFGIFCSWDYPGVFCAIAAGSIIADSASTKERLKARLTGRLGPCTRRIGGPRSCCASCACYDEPTCGAPLHIFGLLAAVLFFSSVFFLANTITLGSLRLSHDRWCDGYTSYEKYQQDCPAEVFTSWGYNNGTGYQPWAQFPNCWRWRQCSELLYRYTISALSLICHMVFLVCGSIALDTYKRIRRAVAGTPLVLQIGGDRGCCGGPTNCYGHPEETGYSFGITGAGASAEGFPSQQGGGSHSQQGGGSVGFEAMGPQLTGSGQVSQPKAREGVAV